MSHISHKLISSYLNPIGHLTISCGAHGEVEVTNMIKENNCFGKQYDKKRECKLCVVQNSCARKQYKKRRYSNKKE